MNAPPEARNSERRIVEALSRIVRTIQTSGELPSLLTTIMRESRELLDSEASSLFLYDAEADDLYFEVVVGGDEKVRSIRIPMGQGIVGSAAKERKTLIVNDCATDSRHLKVEESSFVTRNLIAAPMIQNDRLIGVIEVLNKHEGRPFDELDAKVLEILSDQAAGQIENTHLMRAKVQAERLAAVGTAAAGLAHYIKNVLGNWKGSASLIDFGLPRGDLDIIGEAWPILKRSNEKIAKLVQDMLTISRERKPERSPLDLNELIREVMEECRVRAEEAGVALAAELDAAVPVCDLDRRQMHDVILNLVGNAIEAVEETRAGSPGGEVSIRTKFGNRGDKVVIQVADNGPGMTPEIQTRILEPFFSTKGSRGTGLGLAVARKAIEEHGGRLRLNSAAGQGTTFTIELPCIVPEGSDGVC